MKKKKTSTSFWLLMLAAVIVSWAWLCHEYSPTFFNSLPGLFIAFIFGTFAGSEEKEKEMWKKFNDDMIRKHELEIENYRLKQILDTQKNK